jgi:hypothetical protein
MIRDNGNVKVRTDAWWSFDCSDSISWIALGRKWREIRSTPTHVIAENFATVCSALRKVSDSCEDANKQSE